MLAAAVSVSCAVPQLEISELEEQKVQAEQQVKHLKEVLDKVQSQQVAAAGWGSEQERR